MQFHQWAKSVRPVVPGNLHGPSYARELISMFTTVNEGDGIRETTPQARPQYPMMYLPRLCHATRDLAKG